MKNVKAGHAKPIVCLDAGHYGKYNRSPVVPAYYESDMNWKLHNYQKTELERYGFEVITTRPTQGKDLSLFYRGRAAEDCDLFLSDHSNACNSEDVDYPLVIVQLDGKGDTLGEKLAKCIQDTMGTKQDGRIMKRKGKSGGEYYGVLRGAASVKTMGMILEHSFHTCPSAARWLLEDENLRKLAKAEAKVIAEYYGLEGSQEAQEKDAPAAVKVDYARGYSKAKKGTYRIVSDDGVLNLRAGAGADKQLIEAMPTGSKVTCYGYHTDKWLYVRSEKGNTGFCHGGYLKKI